MRTLALLLACSLAASTHAATFLPAEGVWQFPAANGSGLTLDIRDGTIGIGLYTYDDAGANVWYSGAGQLVDGVLSTSLAVYRETAPGTVTQVGEAKAFNLSFTDSTQGTLTFGETTGIAVHHAAFGADYVEGWTPGPDTYALPDLRGRWLFATRPSAEIPQPPVYDIEFVATVIDETGTTATFRSLDYPVDGAPDALRSYDMVCGPQPSATTRCLLTSRVTPLGEGEAPVLIGEFDPYDLSPNRAVGSGSDTSTDTDVIGFRLPADPMAAPSPGIWQIAGRNGSGFTLDVRENGVAVGLFTYDDEGNATWSLSQGPIMGGTLTAPLLSFTDGSCLGCPQQDPTAVPGQRTLALQFIGATRGLLTIDDNEAVIVSLLPYGADYAPLPLANDSLEADFGPHPMPALSGYWVFSQGDIATARAPDEGIVLNFVDVLVTPDDDGQHAERISAHAAGIFAPAAADWDTEAHSFDCETFGEAVEVSCEARYLVSDDGLILDPPPPPITLATAAISDVSGNRILATGAGDMVVPVWGFRIPPAALP